MLKSVRSTLFILVLIAIVSFQSCTYDVLEKEPCTDVIPDSVSFSANILPLFRANCSLSGCHSGSIPAGSLNLEDSQAYTQLTQSGTDYINTATPKISLLYMQMTSVTEPMPPTGPLDECRINLVLKWIEQGAKNN